MTTNNLIEVTSLTTGYGSVVVHENLNFTIKKNDFCSVIGGSGSGKTTLLRSLICLLKPISGSIKMFDKEIWELEETERTILLRRISVLFQEGALFSGLTILDNLSFPLIEFSGLNKNRSKDIAKFWLSKVGLEDEVINKLPSELSGGMKKRAALARALILEPEILFLDEPTSGLDPIAARKFDELLKVLHDEFNMTVFMISHDVISILNLSTDIMVLGKGKMIVKDKKEKVINSSDKWISEYFSSGLRQN